jgi:uncharacterized protein (DUF2147 family)
MKTEAAWPIAAAGMLFTALAGIAGAAGAEAPAVPEALRVPSGQVLAVTARGIGVQIYECVSAKDDPSHFSWTLKSPEAVLQLGSGVVLGKHYAGPTWESTDGSKVFGEVTAKLDAPDSAAIPWLLLRAKSTSGAGIFSAVGSIQRLATVGGRAPATGCDQTQSGKETRVPYSAEYRFFTARPADVSSPKGVWKTFDDKTGKARAIVRIYEQDGKLFGRIEQSFMPGAENRVCVPCTDERKDRPIIGLVIIRNMKADGDEFNGGDILDPESGSVYRCKMHVERDGGRLVLRGYIGFSLLGRSQTWERQG